MKADSKVEAPERRPENSEKCSTMMIKTRAKLQFTAAGLNTVTSYTTCLTFLGCPELSNIAFANFQTVCTRCKSEVVCLNTETQVMP